MNPGILDERLTLQRERTASEGGGVTSTSFEDVVDVWASVEELEGREYFQAQRGQAEKTHRLRVRRPMTTAAGVNVVPTAADQFVTTDGRTLRVEHVRGRKRARFYEIMCVEVT